MEHDNRRKWHFNKEVSAGDAVGLALAIAAVFIAYFSHDTRIALLEQSRSVDNAYMRESIDRLETSIGEINNKLDRLIEKR